MELLEHLNGLIRGQCRNCIDHGTDVRKATACSLFCPFPGVAIAIEGNSLMLDCKFLNVVMKCSLEIICLLKDITGIGESLCNDGIQDDVGLTNGILGSNHTELELVTSEGEGRSTVTIGSILHEVRKGTYAGLHLLPLDGMGCRTSINQLIDHILQLLTEVYRDNAGRSFIATQSVIITNIRCGLTKKICMIIYGCKDTAENQKELHILMRGFAWIEKVDSIVGNQRPVVMLTGTIYTCEGLLMQQALQTMAICHLTEGLHDDLVMIHCNITLFIDRSQLVLCRSNFVMFGLRRNTQLPEFDICVLHEGCNLLLQGSKVMVIHLLTLRRHCSEEGTSGIDQILSCKEVLTINDEVFLLDTNRRSNLLRSGIAEEAEQSEGLLIDHFHGTKKRSLLIECFTRIRAESSRDAEGCTGFVLTNEGRRSTIPGSIATCFEGRAETTGREGGCIRLALDQFLAGEAHKYLTGRLRSGDEGVMLLSGNTGQRLEPMGIMGSTLFNGPFLHLVCNNVSGLDIEFTTFTDRFFQFLIRLLRKAILHDGVVKDIFAIDIFHIQTLFIDHFLFPFYTEKGCSNRNTLPITYFKLKPC